MHVLYVGIHLFCWLIIAWADVSPVFLSQYIKNNDTATGKNLSQVDPKQFLGVKSYSGYITVDEGLGSNLFFWYFPVAGADVSTTPLIIWLQGGPGGTSLVGVFLEIGPFAINATEIQSRPSTWGQNHSLLFIDNPVGSGLSFTKSDGYAKNLDTCADHLYSFLQQFLTVFPELRTAPLYIAGESYAGRYVPAFAKKIFDHKETREGDRKINLQGLIMGNPLFNYKDSANVSQIFYHWGLIDQQGVGAVKEMQDAYIEAINKNASDAHSLRGDLLDALQDLSLQPQLFNVLQYEELDTSRFIQYVNTKNFKTAVHGIDKEIVVVDREVQRYLVADFLLNLDSTMESLLEHCRILIYCGQLDLTEPCVPNAEARRKNWRWSGRPNFLSAHRKPLWISDTVAGYFKSGGGLTEVLVNGAGHLVPIDKPKEAQVMISYFVKGNELPSNFTELNFNDVPDLDLVVPSSTETTVVKTPDPNSSTLINKTDTKTDPKTNLTYTYVSNPLNTVSWVLNGILITSIIVCGILYVRHKRRYRDYLLNDEDSLNNAVLTMSYRVSSVFTTAILNIEQITTAAVQESMANVRPWERDYGKQVIGTPYLFAATTGCFDSVCAHAVLSRESPPDLPSGEDPEPILTFMERTYKAGRARQTYDAGEPLLLTPFIEAKKLEEGREAAAVDSDYLLPDMDSYAGYLTVNKEYNANLWFWYFPVADQNVSETPLILWLQGGPGASSLYGLFTEIGPFFVTEDKTLEEIKYSWGKNHSLLFIDNPVGTGFSFTDDDRGYATNQTTIGENLYAALQQFMTLFPELRKAPLIVAGESYAGKHIPSLGVQILWHRHDDEPINLQGLAIGNGFTDPLTLQRYSHFAREVGLVDDKVADTMNVLEGAVVQFIKEGEMLKAYAYYNYLLQLFLSESRLSNLYNYLDDDISLEGAYNDYLQTTEVRKALHVGNTNFTSIGVVYRKLVPDFMNSARMWLEELLENYRVMLYNGHLDIIVAYHPSVNSYNSLSFSGTEEFKKTKRLPWYHDGTLAGYYKVAGNLTEVMIRGAGHMVPADKPAASLGLISAFARDITLDADTGSLVNVEPSRRRRLPVK
ncbi:uncharacterized protein LOC106143604 [Amyelois transitella]|uniref:uncharacterized protein LOC106143604 n=1 Tax=Amyelois transitella TaxID=680683 RepID=UPI00298F4DE0|nr:uncharacterized protein LOC106143604 [Amyelois transitella]